MQGIEQAVRDDVLDRVEAACAKEGRKPAFLQVGSPDGPLLARLRERGWHAAAAAADGAMPAEPPQPDVLVLEDARGVAALDLGRRPWRAVIFGAAGLAGEEAALRASLQAARYTLLRMEALGIAVPSRLVDRRTGRLLQLAQREVIRLGREKERLAKAAPPPLQAAVAGAEAPATQPDGPVGCGHQALRKWYFCANERGLRNEFRLIRTAVLSARRNTSLVAHCVYDGQDCTELDWLLSEGVKVIRWTPSLEPELRHGYGEKYDTFRGHWLRIDIPILESEDPQILYTDIDVMFRRDPAAYGFSPRYVAVCEETRLGDRGHFNSGVMVMNLPALRAVRPWLLRQVRHRLTNDFRYPAHDQKSLNDFLLEEAEWMRPEFNWKPYWGPNEEAVIVHFHGPKPWHVAAIREGRAGTMKPAFRTLHDRAPAGYDAFIAEFEAIGAEADPV